MKLPKYVNGYMDRHGKPRYYFRRAGFKRVSLPGLPWSPPFMAAYNDALDEQPKPIQSRALPGSMSALAFNYFRSKNFATLKPRVQRVRRGIIERFLAEIDRNKQSNGDKRAALFQREHVERAMTERKDRPAAANDFRKAFRGMMQHAVAIKLRADDPTQGVKAFPSKNKRGIHTWTEAEIEQFQDFHSLGTKAAPCARAWALHGSSTPRRD